MLALADFAGTGAYRSEPRSWQSSRGDYGANAISENQRGGEPMDWYGIIKAFHIIAIIAWMAGLLYLPRLYVYHAGAKPGSELSETLKIMEARLLRAIMNPAMAATWILGLALVFAFNVVDIKTAGWLHAKLVLVVLMSGFHGALARWRKDFAAERNTHTARFYRIANEFPTVLMIVIVILVVTRPF